jgi:hypothetical protein
MDDYFTGTVRQLLARAQHLTERVPPSLDAVFAPLLSACQAEIGRIGADLQALLDDTAFLLPANQPARLRSLRRSVAALDLVETQGIAALERSHVDDVRLSDVLARICREVRYPLQPPVVTTLSQAYFRIIPRLNLLCVPLSEGRFLLHLPDLFHEIAHPLFPPLVDQQAPVVGPCQHALARAVLAALDYLDGEVREQDRRRGPAQTIIMLYAWTQSWRSWAVELMCDLFATFTAGPAFAWSHLHLCAKRGSDPFDVPRLAQTSHPADAARMDAILRGLARAGFRVEAGRVQERWQRFLESAGFRPEPEYRRCFPNSLMEEVCNAAFQGVVEANCRIATPGTTDVVFTLLNQAWEEFWRDPTSFDNWERQAAAGLWDPTRP